MSAIAVAIWVKPTSPIQAVLAPIFSRAQTPDVVAPPRTVADIAAVLKQEKFDPERSAKLNADAEAEPPPGADQKASAKFYYQRANARVLLGRVGEATQDAETAIRIGRDQGLGNLYLRFELRLAQIYTWKGDLKRANEVLWKIDKQVPEGTHPPVLFVSTRLIGINTVALGDLGQAETILKRNQIALAEAERLPGWADNPSRTYIEAHVIFGNAILSDARGRFHEAAVSYGNHLGEDANERTVETTDLSHYRIIDFATHGLMPGELNGLTQPALALSAPAVAGVPGDGLLTMEKILALKLDADWVVLSACNTAAGAGAGAGAGAEAASGLGQAFFFAGTRTILVTNWSVHSASARQLVTDLFRRQAADPTLTRAEALRQAMVALLDSQGLSSDGGEMLFSYGHPLFWAPYTIIGDGG